MLHFKMDNDIVTAVVAEYEPGTIARHEIRDFHHATQIAGQASLLTGNTYLPIDNGESVWPRYDVIIAPSIGDPVSYSFNGDSRPCGYIKAISPTFKQITTTDGKKFYRRKNTAIWKYNSVWGLIHGHHNELNPEF